MRESCAGAAVRAHYSHAQATCRIYLFSLVRGGVITIVWLISSMSGLACKEPPAPADEPELPTPYEHALDDGVSEEIDLAQLETEMQAVVDDLLQMNATLAYPAFDVALGWADEVCPEFKYLTETTTYYDGMCETRDGTSFYGDAFYAVREGSDPDGTTWERVDLFAHTRITAPSGEMYYSAGPALDSHVTRPDGSREHRSELLGVHSSNLEAAEGWVGAGIINDLTIMATSMTIGDPQKVTVTGALDGLDGQWPSAWVESLQIGSTATDWACDGEPYGALWMRSQGGTWVKVSFDTLSSGGQAPEDTTRCDGCGAVTVHGEELGEVCLDFSPLTDWKDSPW